MANFPLTDTLRSGCSDAAFRPDRTTASVRDTLTILVMIGNRFDRHSLKKHDEKHRCIIVFVDLRFVFEKWGIQRLSFPSGIFWSESFQGGF